MDKENDSRQPAPSVNQARRRLSMAGLAAPAVMGMLSSRQVLGAVPYQCTISGQISGNASVTGSAADCRLLGDSFQAWSSALAARPKQSPASDPLTTLNSAFLDVYYYDKTPPANIEKIIAKPFPSNPSDKKATLYEILTLPAGTPLPPELEYGRKALLIWHNARTYFPSGSYPLNEADAIGLFNALVTPGGVFSGTTGAGSFSWGNAEIKAYINLLYH